MDTMPRGKSTVLNRKGLQLAIANIMCPTAYASASAVINTMHITMRIWFRECNTERVN